MAINYAALPDDPSIASLIYAIVSTGVEELMLIIAGSVCLTIGLVLNDFGVRVPLWFRFSYAVIGMGGIETARGKAAGGARRQGGAKKRKRKQRERESRVVEGGR